MLLAPRGHWGPLVYYERINIQLLGCNTCKILQRNILQYQQTSKLCTAAPSPQKTIFFFLREGGGCTQANKFLKSFKELSLAVMEQFCILVKTRLRITAIF